MGKGNLLKADRAELLKRFKGPQFKRIAKVVMGDPPKEWIETVHAELLKEKQAKLDSMWEAQKKEKEKKKALEARKKQLEEQRKAIEANKKKVEEERKARVAAAIAKKKEEAEAKAKADAEAAKKAEEDAKKAEEDASNSCSRYEL